MPRKTIVVEYKHAGYTIKLTQLGVERFEVQYGLHIKSNLNYSQAVKELGSCIMHALVLEGRVYSDGKEVFPPDSVAAAAGDNSAAIPEKK